MRIEGRRRHVPLLIAALLLSACAPRLYERQAVQIDHHDLDQFEIRYADFDGCLLKHAVPVSWRLQRPLYTLDVSAGFGSTPGAPPSLELRVSGHPGLALAFPGLNPAPRISPTEDGPRYRLDLPGDAPDRLVLDVLRDSIAVGKEVFRLKLDRCRALSLGDG